MGDLVVVMAVAAAIVGVLSFTCWKGLRSNLFVHYAGEYDSCHHWPASGDRVDE